MVKRLSLIRPQVCWFRMWAYFDSTFLSSACCPSPNRPTCPTCPTRPIGGAGASPGRCHQCRQARSLALSVRPAPRRQRRGLPVLSVLMRDSSNRANSRRATACGFWDGGAQARAAGSRAQVGDGWRGGLVIAAKFLLRICYTQLMRILIQYNQ